jgi:hypothetical protein
MIEFLKKFRSLRGFEKERFDYEESGIDANSRTFTIYGIERKSNRRVKVAEFKCDLGEKMCKKKIERAIWRMNRGVQ